MDAERASVAAGSTKPEAPAAVRAPSIYTRHPVDLTRRILLENLQGAEQAKADGNLTASQRFLRNAHGAAHDLQRAERESKAHADAVTFTREELERARQSMRDRVAALGADLERTGGIVCTQCGRELRIRLARSEQTLPQT